MPITPAQRGLYLDFFALLHPRLHPSQQQCLRRSASTTSAIRRGLLATEEAERQRSEGQETHAGSLKWQRSKASAYGSTSPARLREQPSRADSKTGSQDINTWQCFSGQDGQAPATSASGPVPPGMQQILSNLSELRDSLNTGYPDNRPLVSALQELHESLLALRLFDTDEVSHKRLKELRRISNSNDNWKFGLDYKVRSNEIGGPATERILWFKSEKRSGFRIQMRKDLGPVEVLDRCRRVVWRREGTRQVGEKRSGNANPVDGRGEENLFDVTPPLTPVPESNDSPLHPRIRRTQGQPLPPGGAPSSKPGRTAHGDDYHPISIPYTTSASVFLYGTNPVLAALRANRRKLHRLYYRSSHNNPINTASHAEILALAQKLKVPIAPVLNSTLLDKMSQSRPHNGIVLEASRLPAPPVLALGKVSREDAALSLTLAPQTAEEVAVNGAPRALPPCRMQRSRYPLIVLLDGITDEGNLGNILRTAHFFGVTAVAVSTPTCTDLNSAIVAKASAGACEAVRLLALPRPAGFVAESARAGWKIYAAVAPPEPDRASARDVGRSISLSGVAEQNPLEKHPVILMLGSEGRGLPESLSRKSDILVSIPNVGRAGESVVDVGVDSLNVSVAAGVLVEAFLREVKSDAKGAGHGENSKRRESAFTDDESGFVGQDDPTA